jgi:Flp pilus assembly protein TadG
MSRPAALWRDRKATTAVEFALVGSIFIPLCLAILDTGLLMWTKGALQSTAALTARCAAILSPDCTDSRAFAVATAGRWVFPGIITDVDVTPAPAVVCITHSQFMKVTITSSYWAGTTLTAPFSGKTLTSVAYFPVAAAAC